MITLDFGPEFMDEFARRVAAQLTQRERLRSPWMTASEAAGYCRIPLGRFENVAATGAIPRVPQGKAYVYHRDELDRWMARGLA